MDIKQNIFTNSIKDKAFDKLKPEDHQFHVKKDNEIKK